MSLFTLSKTKIFLLVVLIIVFCEILFFGYTKSIIYRITKQKWPQNPINDYYKTSEKDEQKEESDSSEKDDFLLYEEAELKLKLHNIYD